MPNKLLITEMDDTPKQLSFANHAGDFSPSAGNSLEKGTPEDVELVLLNLANGAAVQSDKVDLGANWAEEYAFSALVEMQVAAATARGVVQFWWNASSSATAATGNMGGASGSVGAYDGYSADLTDAVNQLIYIGEMLMTDDAVDSAQTGFVGILKPPHRYGSLIVVNNCGQTICDTDDIEAHVVGSPVTQELQAA